MAESREIHVIPVTPSGSDSPSVIQGMGLGADVKSLYTDDFYESLMDFDVKTDPSDSFCESSYPELEPDFDVKTGPPKRNKIFDSLYDCPKVPKYQRRVEHHARKYLKSFCKDKFNMNAGLYEYISGKFYLSSHKANPAMKLLEDTAALITGIKLADNKKQVLYAYMMYAKCRCGDKALTQTLFESLQKATVIAWSATNYDPHSPLQTGIFYKAFTTVFSAEERHAEMSMNGSALDIFELLIKGVRSIVNEFTTFQESDLYKKVYKFFLYILSASVFEEYGIEFSTFNFTKVQEEAIRKKHHMGLNFMLVCADTITFICERVIQYIRTNEMSSFLHGSTTYDEWVERAMKVKSNYVHIHNLEAVGTNYFEFVSELNRAHEDGEEICRMASKLKRPNLFASKLSMELHSIKLDVASKAKALESRKAPFSVVVFGGTSVAKSSFTKILVAMYCKAFNLPMGDEHIYTRNANDEYWVNFMSSMHTIILDDIAYMHPNIATQGDPTLMEALQINNNVPFVPVQAALEDKGRTPLRSELLIATTNRRDLNAKKYFSCPGAILRRFPWVIDLRVKDEYAKPNGMLDSSKIVDLPVSELDNFWKITVYEVLPAIEECDREDISKRENVSARYVERLNTEDISVFCSWYIQTANAYRQVQNRVMRSMHETKKLEICMGRAVCDHSNCSEEECWKRGCFRPVKDCDHSYPGCQPLVMNGLPIDSSSSDDEEVSIMDFFYCGDCGLPERDCTCDFYGCPNCWQPYMYCRCETPQPSQEECEQCHFVIAECRCLEPNQGEDTFTLRPEVMERVYRSYSPYWTKCVEHSPRYTLKHLDNEMWSWGIMSYLWTSFIIFLLHAYFTGPRFFARFLDFLLGRYWYLTRIWGLASQARVWKCALKYVGSEVEHKLLRIPPGIKALLIGLTTISTAYTGYYFMSQFWAKDPQVSDASEFGRTPDVTNLDEEVNPWYKDDYDVTPLDIGSTSISWKDFSREQVISHVRRNCVFINAFWQYENTLRKNHSRGFVICGNWLVMNHHCLPPTESFELEICRVKKASGITENVRSKVNYRECKPFPEKDLVLVPLRDMPPFADMRGLLSNEDFSGKYKSFYLMRMEDGTDNICQQANTHVELTQNFISARPGLCREIDISGKSWTGTTETPMKNGHCGAILIAETPLGPTIVGIHSMSRVRSPTTAYAMSVDKDWVDLALQNEVVVNAGSVDLCSESVVRELGPLHAKSPFRYIESGVAFVYGSLNGFRAHLRSSVKKTMICDTLLSRGYTLKHTAPVMKGWGPKRNALLAMVEPTSKFDPIILDQVTEDFYQDLRNGLSDRDLSELHTIPLREAVNGVAGLKYVDHINRSTSAGYPWMKSKKAFLQPDEVRDDGLQNPVMPTQEILDKVDDCIGAYRKGERYNPIFCANLKDEAVTFAKRESESTRVFAGAPFHWIIVGRMFLLMFLRLMYKNPFLFEAAPGINATSFQWGDLYKVITKHGKDRMVAGDFKNFDKKMSSRVMMNAFRIIIRLCVDSGNYSDEEIQILWGLANDVSYPWFYFFGDLVQFLGTNPSGHFMTVQLNSIVNSLYMRYCFAILSKQGHAQNFKEFVSLMTYGDDNIMSVSEKCPWFNHTSIAEVLAGVGIVYTMADKGAKSVPYINISECTFLKRSWKWSDEVGAWMAPLDKVSIEKRLLIGVASKKMDPAAQAVSNVRDSIMDAFHHGHEYFEKITRDGKWALEHENLTNWIDDNTFPIWSSLVDLYKDGGLGNTLPSADLEPDPGL